MRHTNQKAFLILSLFVGIFLLFFLPLSAAIYYVDATTGDDGDTGLTEDLAWQTWNFVRVQIFAAGDTILFKCGETWILDSNEYWNFDYDGTAVDYITIDSYGSGAKPIFDAEIDVVGEVWANEGGNVWSAAWAVTITRCRLDGQDSYQAPNVAAVDGITYLWHYDGVADKLYVYATADPDGFYTSIKIANNNNWVFYMNGCDYIKIQNVRMHGGAFAVRFHNTTNESYIEFNDCDIWYGYIGVRCWKTSGGGGTANYITFDGCDIDAKLNLISMVVAELEACAYDGISAHNECNNWTIQNSTFGAYGHNMIALYNYNVGATQGVNNCIVQNNTFDGSDGAYCRALTFGGYDGKCTNNIFRYNIVHDTNCRIQFGGNDNEFYYNLVYDIADTTLTDKANISQGIDITEVTGGMVCVGARVYNNVFYNTYNEGIRIGGATGVCYIKNNIASESAGNYANCALVWIDAEAHEIYNNCFYDSDSTDVVWSEVDLPTGYQTVVEANTGHAEFSNNIGLDPLFINAGGNDFRLLMASLCINAGVDVGFTLDYRGRSIRHAPDIGAYEDPTNALFW